MSRTRTFRLRAATIALGALPAFAVHAAWATFTSAPSAPSMSFATATLAAPTSPSVTNSDCTPSVSRQVTVSWTATISAFADGYEAFRSLTSGGPYLPVATVSGQSVISYIDTSVLAATTYYYVVQATKVAWRSANSTQVSVTTPSLLCV